MNPLKPVWDYLRGEDLKVKTLPAVPEQRLYQYDYGFPATPLKYGMLIHGPGASDLLAGEWGADGNSAVFACLTALSSSFIEAPLRVYQTTAEGERDWLPNHPLQGLLDEPNPDLTAEELWWWVQWALHCDGNAYLRKIRAGDAFSGNVVRLWPLSPRECEPMTRRNSGEFISFYRRDLGSGHYEDLPPENIVHLRLGIDDRDKRKGISPIKRLLRLVASDDEATRFANTLLGNFAVPGLVITTPQGVQMDKAAAEALRDRLQGRYGEAGRGLTAVLDNGATAEQLGWSPEQLNLKVLHQIPETRICAVMRVPPAVAGVSVGLEQTSNYASFREVREMFTEQTLAPLWTMSAATLNRRLKPDFESDRNVLVAHDLSSVRALQEDANAKFVRTNLIHAGGILTTNEARALLGYDPIEGGDVLKGEDEASGGPGSQGDLTPNLQVVKALAERKAFRKEDLPAVYAAMLDLAAPAFQRDLEGYFDRQRKTVKRRLVSGGG
jgi:HK97 family phage portal protein